MSRTKKRAYTGSKRFDSSCRNHGSCPWCKGNRTYNENRDKQKAEEQIKDYECNPEQ